MDYNWDSRWGPMNRSTFQSFGKRTAGCSRRPNECLILEPSEMIVIDYPDVQLMKPNLAQIRNSHHPPHLHRFDRLPGPQQHEDVMHSNTTSSHLMKGSRGRYNSEPDASELPPELRIVQSLLHKHEQYAAATAAGDPYSRTSDTSSAYSGSDLMQSDLDLPPSATTTTTPGDSDDDDDDEEGYVDTGNSLIVRDTVHDCLEKEPAERTDDDIEVLLEFMQHLPAFANMTLATRRALCAVMVFAIVEKQNTVVMKDNEELDSWSVILNGHVEVTQPNGTIEHLHWGDSFGITPTMEKLYHRGTMRTKEDDCQFVCIAQSDYYRILNQGEENTRRHEEHGQVVMVTEHRVLDSGNRKGHIVIRGAPQKLLSHLVEEHSSVDPTYVEDLLLTYRTFLKSPMLVADKLLAWFNDASLRDKVTRVVLLWVNNHFNDFETEPSMAEFLEKFEDLLEREHMGGQLRLLNIACAAKARARTVVLTRATRDEVLHFKILGGLERGCGIFISKVERASKAHEAGLKRGDQILEVNNHNFEHIAHNRALDILRGTTHLSITVKSNLLAFKEMIVTPDSSPSARRLLPDTRHHRLSAPDLDEPIAVPPIINSPAKSTDGASRHSNSSSKLKDKKDGFMSQGHRTKIRKALAKFSFLPRNVSSDPALNQLDDPASFSRVTRKGSSSSNNSSPLHLPTTAPLAHTTLSHSASNPDLSTSSSLLHIDSELRHDCPEHVIKVFRHDQTCKYLPIHRETTAREAVMLTLKEFGMSDSSSNYSLCEVSVEGDSFVKQKRLPDQICSLPERIGINARYYLKCNLNTEPLVPDELVLELVKECQTTFLQLNSTELAAQLTLRDFQMYHDIEPTEYIDDLYELNSRFGTPHLNRFSELSNKEMFWVITEVCSEINVVKRMKILKQFVKIARHCKDCKNFNSMFAIISGLGHGSVSRLRQTWDRLPTKYSKLFEDLQDLMDPSRNMSKYRNLVNSEIVQPPLIPFFPVVKKDLAFINLGNDSKVDGLINFEKLRMIAKEVRHVSNMASAQYDFSSMFLRDSQTVFSAFTGSMSASAVATLRRKRRNSALPNPKKMFEEAQMTRRVRAYLQNMDIIEDEMKMNELSLQCEPPTTAMGTRKRDPSPSPTVSVSLGPKFDGRKNSTDSTKSASETLPRKMLGAESPEAVRKLMSLSEKVRPHNSKQNPLPPHHALLPLRSPRGGRRPGKGGTAAAVNLSPESSSVVSLSNMTLKKSSTSGSVGSAESNSPTNSVGGSSSGSGPTPHYETDSGHNSIASSNFDSHSSSSVGSSNSPPTQRRHLVAGNNTAALGHHATTAGCHRPPPYHLVVQNNTTAYPYSSSGCSQPPYRAPRRPPDYQAALQRRQQSSYHARSHSYEGIMSPSSFFHDHDDHCHDVLVDGPQICVDDDAEEQVSAV